MKLTEKTEKALTVLRELMEEYGEDKILNFGPHWPDDKWQIQLAEVNIVGFTRAGFDSTFDEYHRNISGVRVFFLVDKPVAARV